MLKKNEAITLQITGCTSEGSGVGHSDGIAVFVPDTAAGDTVLCRIIKAKSSYAVGKLIKILTPSPDRQEPDCPVASACGGCVFRHIKYDAELTHKHERVREAFSRIGHIEVTPEPIIGAECVNGYRNKAQYPVAQGANGIDIGFYARMSHRVVNCADCALQPDEFSQIRSVFIDYINEKKLSVYNENTGTGLVRNLFLRKAFSTGELMVCIVINGDTLPAYTALLDRLKNEVPGFTTLVININKQRTNAVTGKKTVPLYGDGYITDVLCGLKIRLSALSFYQVNRAQAQRLYGIVKEYAGCTPESTVLDLYCGTGTIGLSLARDIKSLVGVELIPEAVSDANINASANSITNARFICADAQAAAEKLRSEGIRPDTVILDPPRKGADRQLLETVAAMKPERIVYVSCDPATLARDCEHLSTLGCKLRRLCPVDLFPRTAHVECVALITREPESQSLGVL